MFVARQQLQHPIDQVFAWHSRPGAIHRLSPPWQPVRVTQEAGSLRDGVAVLAFPAGRRWVAQHDAAAYVEGRHFADELASRPFLAPVRWRHDHDLTPAGAEATTLTDTVDTVIPDRLVAPIFDYRHRQLAGDLAAHAWASALRPEPMTVAITGASGLVGTALGALLTGGGHHVIRLVRGPARGEAQGERSWNPHGPVDPALFDGVDAVVHLAGASIAGRFTTAHREAIRGSRIEPTRALATAAAAAGVGVFVCASAIGFYGSDRGDEVVTETSPRGGGFLADVVEAWEEACAPAVVGGARVVNVRTGIVQSPRGGALRLQRPLFAAGLGGRLGDGRQWLSWIGIDDLIDVYLRALVDDRLRGPVNAVAPLPVTGREYAATLGRALHRPALLPAPAFGTALILGREGATEVALASQRVEPTVLAQVGHEFRFPDLEPGLRHLLGT
ncbi:TIGR01777 family oxidoreductase [Nocardioides sp.]|uniref:TIGR01777 family oxidoreductase n=1 Tax=Nocardioides sp. TaxID=35761 RepID=UPI0026322F6E|nr:TIGR01777 family oxidoreductase [Nocardioides sp.]